jgi:peptidoglycan/xylan/chitin deacetylase (PgdA/CDA1 family)
MYHYVKRAPQKKFKNLKYLSKSIFLEQIRRISNSNQHVFNYEEFIEESRRNNVSDKPGWLLTFDDGLNDHHSVVADILDNFNLPAIFFISSGHLNGEFLRVHLIQYLIGSFDNDEQFVDFIKPFLGENRLYSTTEIKINGNRWDSLDINAIKYFLQTTLSKEKSLDLLKDMFKERGITLNQNLHSNIYLNPKQIIDLTRNFTIGLHSHHHDRFSELTPSEIKKDLSLNIATLESYELNLTNNIPLALPYGSTSRGRIRQVYEDLKISHVFTTRPKEFRFKDNFSIPRFDCNDFNKL